MRTIIATTTAEPMNRLDSLKMKLENEKQKIKDSLEKAKQKIEKQLEKIGDNNEPDTAQRTIATLQCNDGDK